MNDICPKCGNEDKKTIGGSISGDRVVAWYCFQCKHLWQRKGLV